MQKKEEKKQIKKNGIKNSEEKVAIQFRKK